MVRDPRSEEPVTFYMLAVESKRAAVYELGSVGLLEVTCFMFSSAIAACLACTPYQDDAMRT